MNSVYYIGLDIHKKSITFVIKTFSGQLIRRGAVEATRPALTAWANEIDHPWTGGREAASRAAAREGRCNGPRPPRVEQDGLTTTSDLPGLADLGTAREDR